MSSKVIDGLKYTNDHEWVKVEGNTAVIGITDYAQAALGSIVYVELPDTDTEFEAEDTFGVVESVKAASDMFIPVSCKIIETNQDVVDEPSLVNTDAFENWLVKVELSDESQLEGLLDADAYRKLLGE